MGEGLGGWVKKLKELRSTNCLLRNNHWEVKYSIGNVVNNSLITMYGVSCVKDDQDDHCLIRLCNV